ncbi:LysR substrate-binding domain-containing protein [Bowmanella dokdonensis]|uniref:LysR family transcriptional regulator n=1 Tax=Bowmanella dokdonensis TaxID=751969 RepID=A0A939DMK0_9ALTE|nr:LysR substrate-binding domain-containing protein [Bowmanella dokdonensis]MBN7825397.1 LysR family transcriptional regulator [Bowmanella dokdonensis]
MFILAGNGARLKRKIFNFQLKEIHLGRDNDKTRISVLEVKHLKTLLALERAGSLAQAADLLFVSQSALSHQLRELENRIGTRLFERKTDPLQFTSQGTSLLNLAREVIPRIRAVEQELRQHQGSVRELKIGIECHACFQWLLPAIAQFNGQQQEVNLDLIGENLFDGIGELERQSLDLLFTDDRIAADRLSYEAIGEFELVLVMAPQDSLAQRPFIQPEDLRDKKLLTYPVPLAKLDIFRRFLQPARCQPGSVKTVANSSVMLQMVAAGLGVAAVPDWLVRDFDRQQLLVVKTLAREGLFRPLYAAYAPERQDLLRAFLPLVKQRFADLMAGTS